MRRFLYVSIIILLVTGCSITQVQNEEGGLFEADLNLKTSKAVASCQHSETAFNCVKVVEVHDGDSVFVDIPGICHPFFGKRMGVRIFGIDTPELETRDVCEKKKGLEAKSLLEGLLSKAKRVDIVDIQKDKFFRILGVVVADGRSIADELIRRKLAYSYYGEEKSRRNWCK